jgi:hypothetical protein
MSIEEELSELKRRMLVVEEEIISENIQLAKRLWEMICKYEPELAKQRACKCKVCTDEHRDGGS